MSQHFNYIAFFDLDRTIISSNSGEALIHHAYKAGYMKLWNLLYGYYLSVLYHFKLMNPVKIINKMGKWLSGFSESEINIFSVEVFEKAIKKTIHQDVYSEIKVHKEKNAEIVLLTSSIANICNPIADYLKFDYVICSEMEIINNLFTGKIIDRFCYDKVKLERLKEYCALKHIALSDVYYYGDSMADLPVLAEVGNPICINPGKKLRKIAGKNNWTIKEWH
ncbi:MAG: haloacid dehalogenase-like hydrolase [Chlorobi bacterium]|nr:haloacid dehalogenase-like hydrolase [Chlorobiota bacterium]